MAVRRTMGNAVQALRDQLLRARQSRPRLPANVNLPVTGNCNARCTMCDVWKTKEHGELTAEEVARILSSDLFRKVRHVGLSGGEPALRGDLPQYVASVVESLPQLKSMTITTHGFMTTKWARFLPEIKNIADNSGVGFSLNISLDGPQKIHDAIRGVRGGYLRSLETAKVAANLGIDVEWQFTAITDNIYALPDLLNRDLEPNATIVVRKGIAIPRLDNTESIRATELGARESAFLVDVLRSDLLKQSTRNIKRRLFYMSLARQLEFDGKRSAPCVYRGTGLMLDAQGDLYQCSIAENAIGNVRERTARSAYLSTEYLPIYKSFVESTCTRCQHDQSGPWALSDLAFGVLRQTWVWKWLVLGRRAIRLLGWTVLSLILSPVFMVRKNHGTKASKKMTKPTAVVIGNYGGEHVGDAAILAGVARALALEEMERIIVLSTRPYRTEVWAEEAREFLEVEVLPYRLGSLRLALGEAERLVYAGGPIMEGPELLAQHLAAVVVGRASGLSTHAVAVGWGPFRRRTSTVLASALIQSFDTVSVRSAQDAAIVRQHRGRSSVDIDRDAAEMYLDVVLQKPLSGSGKSHRNADVSALLAPRTIVVGLCLRPFWHPYTFTSSLSQEDYYAATANAICDAFERAPHVRGVVRYFAMNADTYGGSDFLAVKCIESIFQARGVEFEVFYKELSVVAALDTISDVDIVLTSRFHALVFARRLSVPRVGIAIARNTDSKVNVESQIGCKSRGVVISPNLQDELAAAVFGLIESS